MWAQPWAWLGLAGLAVPIAIHLLARHQAVRAAFPTLRFIEASDLNAIKRQRLTDIPLLLLRLLIVALAVAAIAGPRFGSTPRAANDEPAHATVYDMTASAASGRTDAFIDGPRRAHLATDALGAGIDAAAAWAVRQPGEREITVVSDFQRGALDEADVKRVPAGVGLRFERVASHPPAMRAGASIAGADIRMAWPARTAPAARAIRVEAGPDQAAADAMLAAVDSVTPVPAPDVAPTVTVMFPHASDRQQAIAALRPIDQPWMFALAKPLIERWPAIARVGTTPAGPAERAIVAVDEDPAAIASAEIVASLATSLQGLVPASESDPRTIADELLKSWERSAEAGVVRQDREPQGRWLWIAVVGLLIVETWMRRRAA